MRLLLIEDNARLSKVTSKALSASGFTVDCCHDARSAEDALAAGRFDALILDLGLPDGDGIEFLKALRRRGLGVPVLILTARGKLEERILGLNAGADDYLVKPFALDELVARLRALLRRPGSALGTSLRLGNVELDSISGELRIDSRMTPLSRKETALLELLLRRAGRVVGKESIAQALYNFDDEPSENAIEVLVHRVRKRLAVSEASVTLHTIRGIGYTLAEAPDREPAAS